jgi:hypothetical protein
MAEVPFAEHNNMVETIPSDRTDEPVRTENSIFIDYVTESPNASGDDCTALLLPDPVRLAVQVEEPT